jgi:predicted transport protein
MPLFKIEDKKLVQLKSKNIDLERDIQKLTEENLQEIFGLKFIKSEATIQNYRFDTVAFDESSDSFVIIEYKKDKNISVIDQAFAYLSTVLNNKAELVYLYQQKTNKNIKKEAVDWSQTKIILIADSFTTYQESAIAFKNLPLELYEVKLYEGGILSYSQVKSSLAKNATLTSFKPSKEVEAVLKEVKEYSLEDQFGDWMQSRKLFDALKNEMSSLGNIRERITKYYIAYSKEDTTKSFVEVVTQKKGLKLYLRPKINQLKSPHLQLVDCQEVGHWTNGNTVFSISKQEDIPYALDLIKQSYDLVYSENSY